ncbi:MAG: aminotransferase class IV [Dehalococcoidia bacterium]|nr:aminotransferase class IV [Dehalococcoidia bacterium]
MADIVFLNGALVPKQDARISAFDYGFLYGYGLFETVRAYSGRVFRLEQHLTRLARGAEVLGLSAKLTSFDLKKAIYDVLEANHLSEARVRLTVSAGAGEPIADLDTCPAPTVFIAAQQISPQLQRAYQNGYKAVVSRWRQPGQPSPAGVKSLNYLRNVLAKAEAKKAGADEALLLNDRGYLAEGTACNVFLVDSGKLATPSLESGVLPGVTRDAVLEMARRLQLRVEEREVSLPELLKAQEAFLTSAVIEVMPLTAVNGKAIGSGRPGARSKELSDAFRELVTRETGA